MPAPPTHLRTRRLVAAAFARLALLASTLAAFPATAQTTPTPDTYPNHAVTFIVPFSAGGGTDVAGRLIAAKLQQKWGQTVVVDNRAGSAGIVGVDAVAKARPDGYTLLVANVGTQSINPTLYNKKLPYDADTAFAPISLVAELPFALLVSSAFPARTTKELVALAKAQPSRYTFASSGSGGSPHLTAEIFQAAAGVQLVHVPYRGGGPAMADLMGGHVDLLFASVLESSGHVKSGKLRALAVSSSARSPALPDVPTLPESGVTGAESGSWVGLLAPAGTPQAVIDKVAADVKEALAVPDTRQALVAQGATPRATTPEQFRALIEADRRRYGRVIQTQNIRAD